MNCDKKEKKEVICGYFLFYLPNFLKGKRCYVGWLVKYVGPIFFILHQLQEILFNHKCSFIMEIYII